jgi:uncharacterized protein
MRRLGPRSGAIGGLILGVLLCLWAGGFAQAAPTFPALTGRVVDQAHVLSPQAQSQLTQELGALEAKTSRQLIVVTLSSLNGYDIADYGYQLGRAWGVGQKGLNNGVLLIVAPTEHKVRIEVGYGLEPIVTDAMSSLILRQDILPRFHAGDIQGGVLAGTQALVQQLSLDPSTAEAKAAAAAQHGQAMGRRGGNPLGAIVLIIIVVSVLGSLLGGRGGGLGWFLPGLLLGGMSGGFGGRGERDDDFGGGGGGGFSGGGGGSFGGGGSSGSW